MGDSAQGRARHGRGKLTLVTLPKEVSDGTRKFTSQPAFAGDEAAELGRREFFGRQVEGGDDIPAQHL